MSVVWQVPVVDRQASLPRRLLRERPALLPPRDGRPRRVRRERMPEELRAAGASPRTVATPHPR